MTKGEKVKIVVSVIILTFLIVININFKHTYADVYEVETNDGMIVLLPITTEYNLKLTINSNSKEILRRDLKQYQQLIAKHFVSMYSMTELQLLKDININEVTFNMGNLPDFKTTLWVNKYQIYIKPKNFIFDYKYDKKTVKI